jgi:hypothetical protein
MLRISKNKIQLSSCVGALLLYPNAATFQRARAGRYRARANRHRARANRHLGTYHTNRPLLPHCSVSTLGVPYDTFKEQGPERSRVIQLRIILLCISPHSNNLSSSKLLFY